MTRRSLLQGGGALMAAALAPAWAQTPANTTRLIVPFAPGASNDVIGRVFADAMARKTGRSWVVENKPGAGSMLGAEAVAKSAPDGANLLLCASANMGILPAIQKTMRYAVEKDFTFIARIASSPFALTVNAALPVNSFADFIKLAKAKPDAIRFGSAGIGALDYMGAALLQTLTGIDLNIIPYRGMSPVLNDLRAGQIDACIVSPASIRPLALEGKVKVLAVLDKQRSELMPAVPSAVDVGQPQLLVVNWWGIAGPAGMPAATTAALRQAAAEVLADPAMLKGLKDKGFDPAVLVGDDFTRYVMADLKDWRALARRADITMDE